MILKKGIVLVFHREDGKLQLGTLEWVRGKTFFVKDPNNEHSTFTFEEIEIAGAFKFYYNPKGLTAMDYVYEYEEFLF